MVAAAGLAAWPELVPALAAGLGAPDLATLEGSLDCLHKVRALNGACEGATVCVNESNLESKAVAALVEDLHCGGHTSKATRSNPVRSRSCE